MASNNSNIIIKKVKKGGHSHHGGAWKVAYADFVTAMMAFFLLLWLLSSASKEQLQGIADFFAPTIGLKDAAGIGVRGGISNRDGIKRIDKPTDHGIIYGAPPPGQVVTTPQKEPILEADTSEAITVIESAIKSAIKSSKELEEYQENILIDQTPEGLRIQITEKNGKPMFKADTAELERHTKLILDKVVQIVRFLPNYVSISGHTSTSQATASADGSWELSGGRANATRSYMVDAGMDKEQVIKLIAKADTEPLDIENPDAPVNRRIAIVVLKDAKMAKNKQIDPNVPLQDINKEEIQSYMRIQSKDNPNSPEYKAGQVQNKERQKRQTDLKSIKENTTR